MYIFGNEISEPVYFRHHYLDMYILGNEKLLDVYFRDKPSIFLNTSVEADFIGPGAIFLNNCPKRCYGCVGCILPKY